MIKHYNIHGFGTRFTNIAIWIIYELYISYILVIYELYIRVLIIAWKSNTNIILLRYCRHWDISDQIFKLGLKTFQRKHVFKRTRMFSNSIYRFMCKQENSWVHKGYIIILAMNIDPFQILSTDQYIALLIWSYTKYKK